MGYHFHFKQSDFPLYFTDLIFHNRGYGRFDYRMLQEGNIISGYLTDKGVKQAYRFGQTLLNKKHSKKIIAKLSALNEALRDKANLRKLQDSQTPFLVKWQIIKRLTKELGSYYLYCEQPVMSPLEDALKIGLGKNNLMRYLSDPSTYKKFIPKAARHNFDTLTTLGKLKLLAHEAVEDYLNFIAAKTDLKLRQLEWNPDLASVIREKEVETLFSGKNIGLHNLQKRMKGFVLLPPTKVGSEWILKTGPIFKKWKKYLNKNQKKLPELSLSRVKRKAG